MPLFLYFDETFRAKEDRRFASGHVEEIALRAGGGEGLPLTAKKGAPQFPRQPIHGQGGGFWTPAKGLPIGSNVFSIAIPPEHIVRLVEAAELAVRLKGVGDMRLIGLGHEDRFGGTVGCGQLLHPFFPSAVNRLKEVRLLARNDEHAGIENAGLRNRNRSIDEVALVILIDVFARPSELGRLKRRPDQRRIPFVQKRARVSAEEDVIVKKQQVLIWL